MSRTARLDDGGIDAEPGSNFEVHFDVERPTRAPLPIEAVADDFAHISALGSAK